VYKYRAGWCGLVAVLLLQVREEMNKLWRKVFEQNYHKSLDHRSFYFKQSDKKSLMPKAMLQEVSALSVPAHPCISSPFFAAWYGFVKFPSPACLPCSF
jgi:hypothetical protein